jgi:hypothetical protein
MKIKDILDLFISGEIIAENITRFIYDGNADDCLFYGFNPPDNMQKGEYLLYWLPIEKWNGEILKPDYTISNEDGNFYLILIE